MNWSRNLRKSNQEIPLKSVRLVGCLPDEIFKAHPLFKTFIQENKIHLDLAPKQNLMSWIHGKHVSTLDKRWAAQSAEFEDLQDGFFAYIKLKTRGLLQSGEAVALRGKYKIQVDGVALGLSNKYSKIYIKNADVANLEVGQKRKLLAPHFSLAAALWLNGEIQIGRKPQLLGSSEINSLGIHLGLLQEIEIERLY